MNKPPLPREPFDKYEEWYRTQFGMAHHDIWWVKEQQMSAGHWTLLLFAALVAVGHTMNAKPCDGCAAELSADQSAVLALLALLAFVFGSYYVWDLFVTLIESRARARGIAELVKDDYGVLEGAKQDPFRHTWFPPVITAVLAIALGLTLWLNDVRSGISWFTPLVAWLLLLWWGRSRLSKTRKTIAGLASS